MHRENTFWIGGFLTIGLGIALIAGLVWAGAGAEFASAYLAAGMAGGFGVFFVYVGRAEARERRVFLSASGPPAQNPSEPGTPRQP
ncbi:MAG: hypothetical protein L3K10_01890 [Thermoplasmata archaeon]|nr:hypothetical protein [Thermoplasmata archaeon]